ncbi:MAG: hypothetical protein AAF681_11935 [Pseudomonadota bacterium]
MPEGKVTMTPEEITLIRQVMPETLDFPYYPDRESAWVLAQMMPEVASVARLRQMPFGKLLSRPALRPLVAQGGGVLNRRDILAVAHAHWAMHMEALSAAGLDAVDATFALPWHDFELSFDSWGLRRWYFDQTTRQAGNLVLQMGFPSDHAAIMGRYLTPGVRKTFEYPAHPIRISGRPTLAWARLDIDLSSGDALIEEVQSDWLRFASEEVDELRESAPRSRELASMERYRADLVARYGKIWSRAMLLAALLVLRDELALRRVWMHQPGPGTVFKRIDWSGPPRSLYSDLPKSFGFAPTRERPGFLRRLPARVRRKLPKEGPLFWLMTF